VANIGKNAKDTNSNIYGTRVLDKTAIPKSFNQIRNVQKKRSYIVGKTGTISPYMNITNGDSTLSVQTKTCVLNYKL